MTDLLPAWLPWTVMALLLVSETLALVHLARQQHGLRRHIDSLQRKQELLQENNQEMGRQLLRDGKRLTQMQRQQEDLTGRDISLVSLKQAQRLLQAGAPISDIASACQLSKGEVELLGLMGRSDEQATPVRKVPLAQRLRSVG